MMSTQNVFLSGFTITHILPCMADPEKQRALVELDNDVSPVFPYLNAVEKRVIYNPRANALSIKRAGLLITIYPRAASLAKVEGREDATEQLRWFQTLCNRVWEHRTEITPDHEPHRTADPIDVYMLLPGTNCRACGQATCWAFSWNVLFGDSTLDACPPLATPELAPNRQRLIELIG